MTDAPTAAPTAPNGSQLALPPEPNHQRVLIIDFGSQVTQLIARRVRESGVYCEIHPFDKAEALFDAFRPAAVILSGGPSSVTEHEAPRITTRVFELGVPVLAVCYGEQLMCDLLGGKVDAGAAGHAREFGRAEIALTQPSPLFEGLDQHEQVWMSHGDKITAMPPGFHAVAVSDGSPYAAIADETRKFYGIQFHAEVEHTPRGRDIYRNFTHRIAGLKGDWTMAAFRQEEIARIRKQVGKGRVICGLSGGVDSSVAAVLIHEAIGDQLTCVYVDTGLMRLNESEQVVSLFRDHYNIPLIHVDASADFLDAPGRRLRPRDQAQDHRPPVHRGVRQGKRQDRRRRLPGPGHPLSRRDRERVRPRRPQPGDQEPPQRRRPARLYEAETGRAPARTVRRSKSARSAANWASTPPSSAATQRGPGLAIRIPGAVTREKVATLQHADAIYLEEIRKAGLYDKLWQAFAVLLPVKTVGVMGDARTSEDVCGLRAVTSTDGMTADFFEFPVDVLGKIATRIVNEVRA